MTDAVKLHIGRLGNRGEGVAQYGEQRIFVPYALAGEDVRAEIDDERARVVEIVTASPDRIAPICPHFAHCGGCAVQTLAPPAYADWKRGLVEAALRNARLAVDVSPLVEAHGEGRRRVTFHARYESGKARVGFMAARAHDIVEIDACPLLAPELANALPAARAIAQTLTARGKPLDIAITATDVGLDMDLRGAGPLDDRETRVLTDAAQRHDLARLTNHGRLVTLWRAPEIMIGAARVALPPGAFLQATAAGEAALAARVRAATAGAKKIADLFCGLGAFALRLAADARVAAFDSASDAIAALQTGARTAPTLRPIDAAVRDLYMRPLSAAALAEFDAIILDPPRAGALAQATEIAKGDAKTVIAVSCNAQSFARDAAILIAGNYEAQRITPIDQFRYSAHVEIVGVFARRAPMPKSKRRLLG